MDQSTIIQKVIEHQHMALYHNKEATRLIESLEDGKPSSSRKGGKVLSVEMEAKLIAMNRKNKGTGRK